MCCAYAPCDEDKLDGVRMCGVDGLELEFGGTTRPGHADWPAEPTRHSDAAGGTRGGRRLVATASAEEAAAAEVAAAEAAAAPLDSP